MARDIDYRQIEIPEDEHPSEFHYTQRRAQILELVEEAGHPRMLNQARLARRYDVSEAQISKDMDVLRGYIVDNIDERTVDSITETVYQKAIRELQEQGNHMDAVRAVESWNDWLFDRGKVDKEPEKHEHSGEDGGPIQVDITETVVETPHSESDE